MMRGPAAAFCAKEPGESATPAPTADRMPRTFRRETNRFSAGKDGACFSTNGIRGVIRFSCPGQIRPPTTTNEILGPGKVYGDRTSADSGCQVVFQTVVFQTGEILCCAV